MRLFLSLVISLSTLALIGTTVIAQEATPAARADLSSVRVSGTIGITPALEAAGEAFMEQSPDAQVQIEVSNSGKGIRRFCRGEADLGLSSRALNRKEENNCAGNRVAYDQFVVGQEALAVVVNPANDVVECLTADQLRQAWERDSAVQTWQDLDPSWAAEPLTLYGRNFDTGVMEFFIQAVIGEEGAVRIDYENVESHEAVAEAVAGDESGLGFLPFAFYTENEDRLKLVSIDGGSGCVEPVEETLRDGSYTPLAQPLYVYVNRYSLSRPEVAEFVQFYFADAADFGVAAEVTPTSDDNYAANLEELAGAIAGTDPPDGLSDAGMTEPVGTPEA